MDERWNNLFPCQKKRGPYAVLFARKSTLAIFEPVQMPPLPLVMSVGRLVIVPWQSIHSMVVVARGSP